MKIEKIKPIPQYIVAKIKKLDKKITLNRMVIRGFIHTLQPMTKNL